MHRPKPRHCPRPATHVTYTYDAPIHDQAPDRTASERGPPATTDAHTTVRAVANHSHGTSERASDPAARDTHDYADIARLAQVDNNPGPTTTSVELLDADVMSVQRGRVAANTGSRLEIQLGSKIEGQLGKRGGTRDSVQDLINNPSQTVATRDTRHLPGGGRNDAPATAYIDRSGGYVVRNDETGDIVQVSNLNDPDWKSPW